ncbi:hypothetical protein SAY86_008355 [Trapa natans]|uniref:Uncharacterized protein n=1 Tax=Trapa natans TaxID=22666 RepID=A0AAN7QAT7_TRANT|nr:hypothetical protein SAY86_008355 [Trapa natans]
MGIDRVRGQQGEKHERVVMHEESQKAVEIAIWKRKEKQPRTLRIAMMDEERRGEESENPEKRVSQGHHRPVGRPSPLSCSTASLSPPFTIHSGYNEWGHDEAKTKSNGSAYRDGGKKSNVNVVDWSVQSYKQFGAFGFRIKYTIRIMSRATFPQYPYGMYEDIADEACLNHMIQAK